MKTHRWLGTDLFYSSGMKEFAEKTNSTWLIDCILNEQTKWIKRTYPVQNWSIEKRGATLFLTAENVDCGVIVKTRILSRPEFPVNLMNLVFSGNCLKLPQES